MHLDFAAFHHGSIELVSSSISIHGVAESDEPKALHADECNQATWSENKIQLRIFGVILRDFL